MRAPLGSCAPVAPGSTAASLRPKGGSARPRLLTTGTPRPQSRRDGQPPPGAPGPCAAQAQSPRATRILSPNPPGVSRTSNSLGLFIPDCSPRDLCLHHPKPQAVHTASQSQQSSMQEGSQDVWSTLSSENPFSGPWEQDRGVWANFTAHTGGSHPVTFRVSWRRNRLFGGVRAGSYPRLPDAPVAGHQRRVLQPENATALGFPLVTLPACGATQGHTSSGVQAW
ncbi:Centrosomal protein of 63 kDa [Manis javanica]|nr:Centrosomal protein of 63 kDa [Manis javanica]